MAFLDFLSEQQVYDSVWLCTHNKPKVKLTPVPSPTQARDTDPLISLKVHWKKQMY